MDRVRLYNGIQIKIQTLSRRVPKWKFPMFFTDGSWRNRTEFVFFFTFYPSSLPVQSTEVEKILDDTADPNIRLLPTVIIFISDKH